MSGSSHHATSDEQVGWLCHQADGARHFIWKATHDEPGEMEWIKKRYVRWEPLFVRSETRPTAGAYSWINEAVEELKEGQRWYTSERAESLLSGVPVPQQDLGFGSPADIAAALVIEAGKWKHRTDSKSLMEAGLLMERAADVIRAKPSAIATPYERLRKLMSERIEQLKHTSPRDRDDELTGLVDLLADFEEQEAKRG